MYLYFLKVYDLPFSVTRFDSTCKFHHQGPPAHTAGCISRRRRGLVASQSGWSLWRRGIWPIADLCGRTHRRLLISNRFAQQNWPYYSPAPTLIIINRTIINAHRYV